MHGYILHFSFLYWAPLHYYILFLKSTTTFFLFLNILYFLLLYSWISMLCKWPKVCENFTVITCNCMWQLSQLEYTLIVWLSMTSCLSSRISCSRKSCVQVWSPVWPPHLMGSSLLLLSLRPFTCGRWVCFFFQMNTRNQLEETKAFLIC